MNKLTETEFLDFYSKAYDELTDKLGQIAYHKFTGEELFEFVNDAIEYWAKNQRSGYDTEIKRDINSYYCKPPILAEVIRVPESSSVEKELGDFYSHSSKIMNVHTSRLNTLFDLMLKKKVNKPQ